eukprot:1917805-Rhodomonas_salina.1
MPIPLEATPSCEDGTSTQCMGLAQHSDDLLDQCAGWGRKRKAQRMILEWCEVTSRGALNQDPLPVRDGGPGKGRRGLALHSH